MKKSFVHRSDCRRYCRFAAGMLSLLLFAGPSAETLTVHGGMQPVDAFAGQDTLQSAAELSVAGDAVLADALPQSPEDLTPDYDDPDYVKRLMQPQEQEEPMIMLSSVSAKKTKSPFTGLKYTHAVSLSDCDVVHGIDVSKWQAGIDWSKVRAAGVEYVFIRCGYTSTSTFTMYEDPYFKQNIEGAYRAGIKVGIYYFSTALNVTEAKKEAKKTVELMAPYKHMITMPVVYDFESVAGARSLNLAKKQATKNLLAYMDIVQEAGYVPMYYGNPSDIGKYFDTSQLTDYECWLANYTTKTSYAGDYSYWQYSSSGAVNGIKGRVDCNFQYTGTVEPDLPQVPTTPEIPGDPANPETPGGTMNPETPGSITTPETPGGTTNPETPGGTTNPETPGGTTTPETPGGTTTPETPGGMTNPETPGGTTNPETPDVPDTPEPPIQVTGLRMSDHATTSITIAWDKCKGADGYKIYRSKYYGGPYKQVKQIGENKVLSWKDAKVVESQGRQYYYKVVPYVLENNSIQYGADSAVLTAYTKRLYSYRLKTTAAVNLRTQAGTEYDVLTTIPAGTGLPYYKWTLSASDTKWYKVTYTRNGVSHVGYLSGNYVSTFTYGTAKKDVNVRGGAGLSSKVKSVVPNGTKMTIRKSATDSTGTKWSLVNYKKNGKTYKGYVPTKYIKRV